MDFTEKKTLKNPQVVANPVSRFLYLWIVPLFRKGAKEDLNIDDLYDRLPEDDAGSLGHAFESEWKKQCQLAKKNDKKPSLIRTAWNILGGRFAILGLATLFDEVFLRAAQPLILRLLIHSFSEGASNDKNIRLKQYLYTGALILDTLLHALAFHKIIVGVTHLASKARLGASSLIYRKVLKLSKSVQTEDANIGKLVNLLSNDANRFDHMAFHFHHIYVAPIQLAILAYFLWSEMGVSCLVGIGIIIGFLIPFQVVVGRFSIKFRTQIAKRTDERGRVVNEIIQGIRIIKMYAWEKPFSAVIHQLRKLEVNTIQKGSYLRCAFMTFNSLSKITVPYATFIVYVSLGNTLTAEKVYFTISIFSVMIMGMVQKIPLAVAQFGEFLVAIDRMEKFLLLEEQTGQTNLKCMIDTNIIDSTDVPLKQVTSIEKVSIQMESLSARWTPEKITLDKICLNVHGNNLIMVVGPVGSGKSSLLSVLISELPVHSGKCNISGRMSYASQEAWIFSGNLKQNILFGAVYEESRYNAVIKACALEEDLEQLPNGDETIVGEKGISLSGGQKARVNLARALYQKADIYLMDDPLSAVDSRVSRHLFEKCIREYLDGHLRILVTHQLQYLPQADHIIVLNESGCIMAQGNYTDLVAQGVDFVSLMANQTDDPDVNQDVKAKSASNGILKVDDAIGDSKTKQEKNSEKMISGAVTVKTYLEYFKTGNSTIELIITFVAIIASQGVTNFTDVWISSWMNEVSRRSQSLTPATGYSDKTYILVYTVCVVTIFVMLASKSVLWFHYCMTICINLHNRMFSALVRAPVKFFDDNPSGRIMNRFTKDLNSIDEQLPMCFFDAITIFLYMVGIIVVVITRNYYIAIPSAFLLLGLWWVRNFYVKTARDLKRLEAIAKSPLFLHLTASAQGLSTIRALGAQEKLTDQFDAIQDIHTSAYYLSMIANRWFGMWLDIICVLFLTCVSLSFLILSSSTEVGNVGLAITLTLNLLGTSQWGMRQSAETENYMTSVERAFEYCQIKPEASLESENDKKPPKTWPAGGAIKFQHVKMAYDEANANEVLKGLSFEIKEKEKIGIVGRTGAGKSSILVALFRLTEPRGDILIDDISIKEIGLHDLRKNISIIPQDPVLFSGTMRYNLDPFDQFGDDELWKVLKEVNLGDAVPALTYKVSDGGSNFSVGQRQLVCLARAILRNNKIIVMDEATANVDPATDALIQHEIRTKFADCTIITIAHRLHSVIDNDRILVLDNGYLKEFDSPDSLLKNPDSIFSSMVSQVGSTGEANLRKLAKG